MDAPKDGSAKGWTRRWRVVPAEDILEEDGRNVGWKRPIRNMEDGRVGG